jgi:hypothetical protein
VLYQPAEVLTALTRRHREAPKAPRRSSATRPRGPSCRKPGGLSGIFGVAGKIADNAQTRFRDDNLGHTGFWIASGLKPLAMTENGQDLRRLVLLNSPKKLLRFFNHSRAPDSMAGSGVLRALPAL